MSQLINKIKDLSDQYFEEIRDIRRHIHAHPELSFHEFETSKYISSKLDEWGIPYQNGFVKTGIVATISGSNPDKKISMLRADMDALPINEKNEVSYKSKNEGVMHACGHDVHSSCLLGAGKILNDLKNEWEGTVKLIFQPAEEKLPGGASLMIEEGALGDPAPNDITAQHVHPELEAGEVGFKSGKYMASADELYLTVKGKGGHGALPHLNIDPVLIASHIIVSLQQLVSRKAPSNMPTVLSFGKIIGEGATNVIPDEVKIEGTFRTMDENWRERAHKEISTMAEHIAKGMGGSCDVNILKGYPTLFNNNELTAKRRNDAVAYLGEDKVFDLDLRMTSEDFAYYTQIMPGCFYRLGTGNKEQGITAPVHNPKFNIDEEAIRTGMGLMAWLAVS